MLRWTRDILPVEHPLEQQQPLEVYEVQECRLLCLQTQADLCFNSLIIKEDVESVKSDVRKEIQGIEELKLDLTSHLLKKIAADIHKYW